MATFHASNSTTDPCRRIRCRDRCCAGGRHVRRSDARRLGAVDHGLRRRRNRRPVHQYCVPDIVPNSPSFSSNSPDGWAPGDRRHPVHRHNSGQCIGLGEEQQPARSRFRIRRSARARDRGSESIGRGVDGSQPKHTGPDTFIVSGLVRRTHSFVAWPAQISGRSDRKLSNACRLSSSFHTIARRDMSG